MPGHAGEGGVGLKKVESIRQSIIERRNRLGWSDKILAKMSNVPYIVIRRMLE
jgi:ribosome-binding protein aMBF1 (putative translation factor)